MNVRFLCLAFSVCPLIACEFSFTIHSIPDEITIDSKQLTNSSITVENYLETKEKFEFYYGEEFVVNFNNFEGFTAVNGKVRPEMDIYITDKKGDTIVKEKELFGRKGASFPEEDLLIKSNLLVAKPMQIGNNYTLHVAINDKQSIGYYNIQMPFSVVENPLLQTKVNGVNFSATYLYSKQRDVALVDDKISFDEDIYVFIEKLEGFVVDEDGNVSITSSMNLSDASGESVLSKDNLSPKPIKAKLLKEQMYATFVVRKGKLDNPLSCEILVKDNRSDAYFKTNCKLIVEN